MIGPRNTQVGSRHYVAVAAYYLVPSYKKFVACKTCILQYLQQPVSPLQAGLVPFQVRSFVQVREDALSDSII